MPVNFGPWALYLGLAFVTFPPPDAGNQPLASNHPHNANARQLWTLGFGPWTRSSPHARRPRCNILTFQRCNALFNCQRPIEKKLCVDKRRYASLSAVTRRICPSAPPLPIDNAASAHRLRRLPPDNGGTRRCIRVGFVGRVPSRGVRQPEFDKPRAPCLAPACSSGSFCLPFSFEQIRAIRVNTSRLPIKNQKCLHVVCPASSFRPRVNSQPLPRRSLLVRRSHREGGAEGGSTTRPP
jgi:hypothetical protein